MKTDKSFIFRDGWISCLIAVLILNILTGCPAKPVPPPPAPAAPAPQVAQAPVVIEQPVAEVVPDGFIYYPDYEVYYDPGARVYWNYRDGHWAPAPAPFGVSVDVLMGAPSVRMDFHDSPENHHADVVRRYPHGWQPDRH